MAFFALLFILSCKPEVLIPTEKQVVEEPLNTKSMMTLREQLLAMDVANQKETYRSLSPEERRSVWIDKFTIWKELPQFNTQEKAHIQEILDFVENTSFEFSEENENEVTLFSDNWIATAISELGWTEEFALMAVLTLFTPQEFEDAKEAAIKEPGGGGGSGRDCECQYSFFGCYLGGGGDHCSRDIPCKIVYGCGFLWGDRCRGICEWRS